MICASIIYLLPDSKNDLDGLQIYTAISNITIKCEYIGKDNQSKGSLG